MASASAKPCATIVAKYMVKPASVSPESRKPCFLTPWDLFNLIFPCPQLGLVFHKPHQQPMDVIVDRLKNSLAATLTHFVPMSGRLATQNIQNPPSYCVYVDCSDPAGAEFIHAVAPGVTVSDILAPRDVPTDILDSFFALPRWTPNSRGYTIPLLHVQVTQLVDGIFMAFSINHAVADGTSFWHFVNFYSKLCRTGSLSSPPVFFSGQVYVPGSHPPDVGIVLDPRAASRQRVFHFTSKDVARLKAKANAEHGTREISSYQALAALIWRSTTRARGFRPDQITACAVPVNCRSRLEPPLPKDYFGNCAPIEYVGSRTDELLSNNLGWAAWKLHQRLTTFDNDKARSYLEKLTDTNYTPPPFPFECILWFGSSPRLDVYANNFGWGKPVALRWCHDTGDGMIHVFPGPDEGSMDVMMCLYSKFMNTLEVDDEFIGALSSVPLSKI